MRELPGQSAESRAGSGREQSPVARIPSRYESGLGVMAGPGRCLPAKQSRLKPSAPRRRPRRLKLRQLPPPPRLPPVAHGPMRGAGARSPAESLTLPRPHLRVEADLWPAAAAGLCLGAAPGRLAAPPAPPRRRLPVAAARRHRRHPSRPTPRHRAAAAAAAATATAQPGPYAGRNPRRGRIARMRAPGAAERRPGACPYPGRRARADSDAPSRRVRPTAAPLAAAACAAAALSPPYASPARDPIRPWPGPESEPGGGPLGVRASQD